MGWMDGFFQNVMTFLWNGVAQLPWKKVNFTGAGVTVSSNATTSALDVNIPATPPPVILVAVVATTEAITLSGTQTIDGIALGAGAIVLVKDQADASENGLRVVAAGTWGRASTMNESDDLRAGMQVYVRRGTFNAGRTFKLDGAGPFTIDSTNLVFTSLLDTAAAALLIGGTTPAIAFLDPTGIPALEVLPDADGGTTIAATDDVLALSIGLLTNDSPGTDSRLGLRLSGGDGRPANVSDPNNDGRDVYLLPGKAGTGGTGTAKPGHVVITDHTVTHPPATAGMIRTGNPGDWDADGALLVARNHDNDGNVAILSLGASDGVTLGDESAADLTIRAGATGALFGYVGATQRLYADVNQTLVASPAGDASLNLTDTANATLHADNVLALEGAGEVRVSGSVKREDYLAGAAATLSASSGQPTQWAFNSTLQTTDATLTAMLTITLPADYVGAMSWKLVLKSGANAGMTYEVRTVKQIGGTVTVFPGAYLAATAAPICNDRDAALATASCTPAGVGSTVVFTATGVAATTIDWALFVEFPGLKP
jgi:hypothetical protein